MSAGARAANDAGHRRLVEETSLHQLRKARGLIQTNIAGELHMGQGDVPRLERRIDMYVSTLASYLQASARTWRYARFSPGGRAVKIKQFSQVVAVCRVAMRRANPRLKKELCV